MTFTSILYNFHFLLVKPEVKAGCITIHSSEKCCQFIDGRKDYDKKFYKEPCVVVNNVTLPYWDRQYTCQPLCFAQNSCKPHAKVFKGTISDTCGNVIKSKF